MSAEPSADPGARSDEPTRWRRMVLLRHELPDGTHHFDWMLARDDEGPLATFRCAVRLDALSPDAPAVLEAIADHRRAYLEHDGPVSGGRGHVVRVAHGEWRDVGAGDGGRLVELRWAGGDRASRRLLARDRLGPCAASSAPDAAVKGGPAPGGALD